MTADIEQPQAAKLNSRLTTLTLRIQQASQQYHRTASPLLLAVSKRHSIASIRTLHNLGINHFGENYVQEALKKIELLSNATIHWHFIGPLQSNKSRSVAENFDWVHSVDSIKLAQRLSKQRPTNQAPLNICLQVNIDNEPSKAGVTVQEIDSLVRACGELPNIKLRGLMCIPQKKEPGTRNKSFKALASLRDKLQHETRIPLDTLSMGMSDDLEDAIAAGSTIIRIGSALFGPRSN